MREHGLVQSAAYLGLHGHACWTYEDETDFLRGAAEFLADGERLGQRLLFVGPRGGPRPSLPGLEVLDVEAIHSGGATDADAFLALYSAAASSRTSWSPICAPSTRPSTARTCRSASTPSRTR